MGFYSGSATSSDDMLTKISAHCATEGWTILQDAAAGAGRVLRVQTPSAPASEQFVFRSTPSVGESICHASLSTTRDVAGISLTACLGHSGGTGQRDWITNTVNAPKHKDGAQYPIHCHANYGGGAISAYSMFFDKDYEFAVLMMNISGSEYRTIYFGDAIEIGSSSAGPQVCAANGGCRYDIGSQEEDSQYEPTIPGARAVARLDANMFARRTDDGTNLRHWGSNANQQWGVDTYNNAAAVLDNWDEMLFHSSINDFNGLHVLLPITIRQDGDPTAGSANDEKWAETHRLPNLFQVHMRGLTAGDSYYVGEYEYVVWPAMKFVDANPTGRTTYADSGAFGFACRKDA